jgi:hypothetical protein
MQHHDLLLQHPYETLATTSETLENIRFQQTWADGWVGEALHGGI